MESSGYAEPLQAMKRNDHDFGKPKKKKIPHFGNPKVFLKKEVII